jgi:pimeloyl-ACP methyl ester carboxylesterase
MVELIATRLAGDRADDLLVVGPSLGTSVEALWGECARILGHRFEVVGWDLPGHGRSRPAEGPFRIEDLADAVRELGDQPAAGRRTWYAGDSLGGAVGLALALDPGPFEAVAMISSAPKIGTAADWHERADLVRRAGSSVMVARSSLRWFAPGFVDRRPDVAGALLTSLSDSDRFSYAWSCEALADLDLRGQLADAKVPVLVAPGEYDEVVSVDVAHEAVAGIPGAAFHVLDGCGHLPPAEDPAQVARMLTDYFAVQSTGQRAGA